MAVKKGVNQLVVVDVDHPRRSREIKVKGVPSLNNPSWSPDGRYMVFSGLANGRPDLFRLEVETGNVDNLSDDSFSYIHPSWSPDGRYLALSTDRPQTTQADQVVNFNFNLAVVDMEDPDLKMEVMDVFPGAENLNPYFSNEQDGLYFLSNRDGYRNLYFLELESRKVFRMTDFYSGISGITHLSPAISVARTTGEIAYSHYQNGDYTIYMGGKDAFELVEVDPLETDMHPATLPPLERPTLAVVDRNLKSEPESSI